MDERESKSPRKKAGFPVRFARSAALVYVGLSVLMAFGQERYIYYPSRAAPEALDTLARSVGLERWADEAGETLGWRAASGPEPDSVVLVFHGNAGYALHRDYLSSGILSEGPGRNRLAVLFEYPGYGSRPGRPSEAAFTNAAKSAFQRLRGEYPEARFYLVGESIGGGTACALAGAYPDEVSGLLLVTPFTSLTDVARHHYPYLPVRWLLRDRYDNQAALRSYSGPVVIVVAEADTVVPAALGRKLYETYSGPKMLRADAGRTHNELAFAGLPWWTESWKKLQSP